MALGQRRALLGITLKSGEKVYPQNRLRAHSFSSICRRRIVFYVNWCQHACRNGFVPDCGWLRGAMVAFTSVCVNE